MECANLNQRWPPEFLVSIDLISSFVVGINGGEMLSAEADLQRWNDFRSPAISPQIVTGFPKLLQ
jgi:hypothetical protein